MGLLESRDMLLLRHASADAITRFSLITTNCTALLLAYKEQWRIYRHPVVQTAQQTSLIHRYPWSSSTERWQF